MTGPPPIRLRSADPGAWLTPHEVARQLRVGRSTLYRVFASGDLPSVRVGRTIRIYASDFIDYLNRERGAQ
jgi:excisionase family DNA binding protein